MGLRGKLASQSTLIFAVRIFGAGLVFIAQAAMARFWGGAALGQYLLVIAAINLVAVVLPLGFHTIGTYFAAEYRAKGQGGLMRRFLIRAYGQSALVAIGLYLLGKPALPLLGDVGVLLEPLWLPACAMAAASAVVFINGAVLVGLKRPFAGFFAEALFRPMLLIGAFILTLFIGEQGGGDQSGSLTFFITLMAAGYAVVASLHFVILLVSLRKLPEGEADPEVNENARWWRFAAPWVLLALAGDFFYDIDLIALSGMMSHHDLAVFGVCTRIFSLVAFGVSAVYAVTLPDMFEAEAHNDRAGFNRKIGDANLVAAGLSIVLFIGVVIGGPFALMLFGPDFLVGAGPLAVLCLTLAVRSVFGPAALVLSIHDKPWASIPAALVGLFSLGFANLFLVPWFGLMGAALAALYATSFWSVTLWLTARHVAGIDVSIFPRLSQMLDARKRKKLVSL